LTPDLPDLTDLVEGQVQRERPIWIGLRRVTLSAREWGRVDELGEFRKQLSELIGISFSGQRLGCVDHLPIPPVGRCRCRSRQVLEWNIIILHAGCEESGVSPLCEAIR